MSDWFLILWGQPGNQANKNRLTAAIVSRSNTLQQYFQAFALPYFDMHSSEKQLENKDAYITKSQGNRIQAIPGNDQNASPTNQKTAGRKLDRTS